jgi:hypothetical protein
MKAINEEKRAMATNAARQRSGGVLVRYAPLVMAAGLMGCADPIDDLWVLQSLAAEVGVFCTDAFPSNSTGYIDIREAEDSSTDAYTGHFRAEWSCTDGEYYSEGMINKVTIGSNDDYTVGIDFVSGAGGFSTWDCKINDGTMTCEDDSVTWVFERGPWFDNSPEDLGFEPY